MTSASELKARTAHLPPIDTNVKMPAAIAAASARSSALHKQAYETSADNMGGNGEGNAQEHGQAASGTGPTEEEKAAQAAEAAAKAEAAKAPPSDTSFEQKYNSLKGRYDRQDEAIRSLTASLNATNAELARLRAEGTKPAPVQEQRTRENTFVTAEERETYGDDFLDVAARAAESRITPEMQKLREELASVNERLANVTSQTRQTVARNIYTDMDRELPDWRTLNRDPKFLAWVALPDPFSGVIRHSMMTDALNKGDAHRVLAFFRGFLTEEAATDPARRVEPETPGKGKVPLENFAAPGRAKAPAATTPPGEKEIITRAQVLAFYDSVNKGAYKGNEAEKDRLEKMIFEAEADGRIV